MSLLMLAFLGCAVPSGILPPRIAHRPIVREQTYQVLATGLGAAGDGYTFRNARFRFEFSTEFDRIEGYRTPEERFGRGKVASEFLNGGYEFVRGIFGIETPKVIRVVISPELNGDPYDANTQTTWSEVQGRILDGSDATTMVFGVKAFESPSVLAHELTHALTGIYALPAWLAEGLAVVVEADYAHGAPWAKERAALQPLAFDKDGYNILQTWRGDASPLPFRSVETYASAYAIVSELRRRYGDDVFARLFQDFQKTKPHLRSSRLRTQDIIAGLNRVTGRDTRPFFEEIRFRTTD